MSLQEYIESINQMLEEAKIQCSECNSTVS